MKNPVLVIMAAGRGSRYGGMKQMDPIDDEGHLIIDFSLYDAVKAGFKEVIFIIKKENVINGVKFCEYKAVVPELLPVNKVYGGRQQSLHNNIEYNTSNIYSAKFDKNDAFKRF